MLTVQQCKDLLLNGTEFTYTLVENIRDHLYASANLAFELYWTEANSGSKNPLGLLKSKDESNTL